MAKCIDISGLITCSGDMATNTVIYRDIVVDASLPPASLPRRPRILLITHGHADHFRYAYAYREQGVRVAAPRHCVALIENPAVNQMATIGWAGPIDEDLITRYFVGRGVRVDALLEPGEHRFGDVLVGALAAPGHTPGHLIYLFEARGTRILVAGDTVLGKDYLDKTPLPYHTSTVWLLGSLERIKSLDVDVLVPGHGEVALGKRQVRSLLDANVSKIEAALSLVESVLPGADEEPAYVDEIVARLAEKLGYARSKRAYSALSPTTRALLIALKHRGRAEALLHKGVLAWRRRS